MRDELRDDAIHGVDGNREANSRARSRRADDGGVHSDEPATAVKQRAAGVSGIDRSVGLNRVGDRRAGRALNGSSQGGDDAGCESLIETEWIPDRVDGLAYLKI